MILFRHYMNLLKLYFLLFSFLIIPGLSSPTLELYNNDNIDRELNLLSTPLFDFHIKSHHDGLYFKGTKIGLEKVYLQYYFSKQFRIRIGQFKAPAGEEISVGWTQRSYFNHSTGPEKLIPGNRRGLMFSGKNCLSIIHYQARIFNTSKSDESKNTLLYLSAAGKLFLSSKLVRQLDIKTRYDMYYSFEKIFADSLFLSMKYKNPFI